MGSPVGNGNGSAGSVDDSSGSGAGDELGTGDGGTVGSDVGDGSEGVGAAELLGGGSTATPVVANGETVPRNTATSAATTNRLGACRPAMSPFLPSGALACGTPSASRTVDRWM
jgi:hypothetical protein